jgi:hypothetical protein
MAASKLTTAYEAAHNADEVEERCLGGIKVPAEAGLLDERISGETTDEPVSAGTARWAQETQTIDDATGAVSAELERRTKVPGGGYPFAFDGKSLAYVGSRTHAYEFCLAVSRARTIVKGEHIRLPRNFERLSAVAARLYLGQGAECIRLGWPTDHEDPRGHPRDFRQRAALLKSRAPLDSDEWEFAPKPRFGDEVVDNAKDYGMDFVAWKPFPDERIGRITLLGQCACGKNDQASDEKLKELDLKKLSNLFSTLTWLEPVRVFATPFHVPESRRFQQMHQLGGMIFDRARIAAVCEQWSDDGQLRTFCDRLLQLSKMAFGAIKPSPTAKRAARRRRR